jgi:hypothetical protein
LENLKKIGYSEYLGVDGRIILKWILRILRCDLDYLSQDMNQRWAVVYTVMNIFVFIKGEELD